MHSQNSIITGVIHQALFFKGIVVNIGNPARITNESDENLLSVIGIGVNSL
jgi:hypothetical protein